MADRLPAAQEFSVPVEGGVPALLADLATHVSLRSDPVVSSVAIVCDTFDGRLHAEGLELWRTPTQGRPDVVTVREAGRPDLTAVLEGGTGDAFLVTDLPEGPVRALLQDVVEMRAVLSRARLHDRVAPVRVCNDDDKTVVRLTVHEPEVRRRGNQPVALAPRLRVAPVLGYDKEFANLLGLLQGPLPLEPVEWSLADEAVVAAGGTPAGVSSKVAVPLAPHMRADVATVDIARRLAEVVEANLPGTLDDIDTEFLHDLRVAVRRSRSLLKEMKGVLAPADEAQARDDLRWIQEITGPVRDLDVQLEEWPQTVAAMPAAFDGHLDPLRDLLARHRAEALRQMRRHLRGQRYQQSWARWLETLEHPLAAEGDPDRPDAARPIADVAGHRISAVYKKMVQMGRAVTDDSPAEDLHDLRKRGKELRYLLELFGSLWPNEVVRPMVSTLKALQDVLGRFQDDQVQSTYLRNLGPELAATPGGTDTLIALGLIVERLTADQAVARQAFADRFASFAGDEQRQLVAGVFSRKAKGEAEPSSVNVGAPKATTGTSKKKGKKQGTKGKNDSKTSKKKNA